MTSYKIKGPNERWCRVLAIARGDRVIRITIATSGYRFAKVLTLKGREVKGIDLKAVEVLPCIRRAWLDSSRVQNLPDGGTYTDHALTETGRQALKAAEHA